MTKEIVEIPEEYGPSFHRLLGVKMAIGPDHEGIARVELDPAKHFGSRWAHGGLVPALADIASGIAIARKLADAVHVIDGTIEMKVNFLRKATDGDLTATARLLHAGKRVAVTDVEITNQGTLCAKAIVTFMLSRDRAPKSS